MHYPYLNPLSTQNLLSIQNQTHYRFLLSVPCSDQLLQHLLHYLQTVSHQPELHPHRTQQFQTLPVQIHRYQTPLETRTLYQNQSLPAVPYQLQMSRLPLVVVRLLRLYRLPHVIARLLLQSPEFLHQNPSSAQYHLYLIHPIKPPLSQPQVHHQAKPQVLQTPLPHHHVTRG